MCIDKQPEIHACMYIYIYVSKYTYLFICSYLHTYVYKARDTEKERESEREPDAGNSKPTAGGTPRSCQLYDSVASFRS